LVLHTRGGLGAKEQVNALFLASQGHVALAPDYFTPLGVTGGTFDLATFWVRHTDEAKEVIAQALECLKSLNFVDRNRIGAVGYSLGGYFGFVLATRDDVKGVVSYYGAYHGSPVSSVPTKYSFSDIVLQVRAPVLMLHGDGDTTIPIIRAHAVRALLTLGGKNAELVVYPGVEHAFDQLGTPTLNPSATADAQARTLDFLRATLK
jgi:carboxymethylenebutenolidase